MKIIPNITAFLKLVRYKNLLILVVLQYLTRIFLVGDSQNWQQNIFEIEILLLCISTLFVAASGYIINDYYDIKIDLINKPNDVIIGKNISRRNSLIIQFSLNIMALIIPLSLLSYRVAIFIFLCEVLLWYYSNHLKRIALIGNISISLLAFCSVYIIALFYKKNEELILFYAIFSFFTTLLREIIKDIEDIRGDISYGSKTLPIWIGIKNTKIILFIMILFVLITLYFQNKINHYHYYFLLIFTAFPLLLGLFFLYISDKKSDYTFLTKLMKWIMVAGISSMVLV